MPTVMNEAKVTTQYKINVYPQPKGITDPVVYDVDLISQQKEATKKQPAKPTNIKVDKVNNRVVGPINTSSFKSKLTAANKTGNSYRAPIKASLTKASNTRQPTNKDTLKSGNTFAYKPSMK